MVVPTTPEASAHLPTETQAKEAVVERVDSNSSEPTAVKKFGFGAGMRMYAKSLAQIEQGGVMTTPEGEEPTTMAPAKEVGTVPADVAEKPTDVREDVVEESTATAAPGAVVEETRDDAEPTAAPVVAESTAAPIVADTPTPDVVELLSEEEDEESGKVATKSPAPSITLPSCGSVYQHIVDSISFFFRKAEESLDDAHESVCARDVSCAADVENEILETAADRKEEATSTESSEQEKPLEEVVAAVMEDTLSEEDAVAESHE